MSLSQTFVTFFHLCLYTHCTLLIALLLSLETLVRVFSERIENALSCVVLRSKLTLFTRIVKMPSELVMLTGCVGTPTQRNKIIKVIEM